MKVVVFDGSKEPRGPVGVRLSSLVERLRADGVEAELRESREGPRHGLHRVRAVRATGPASISCSSPPEDGLRRCVRKIKAADAVVIGTPVYGTHGSPATQQLLIRLEHDRRERGDTRLAGKPAVVVVGPPGQRRRRGRGGRAPAPRGARDARGRRGDAVRRRLRASGGPPTWTSSRARCWRRSRRSRPDRVRTGARRRLRPPGPPLATLAGDPLPQTFFSLLRCGDLLPCLISPIRVAGWCIDLLVHERGAWVAARGSCRRSCGCRLFLAWPCGPWSSGLMCDLP